MNQGPKKINIGVVEAIELDRIDEPRFGRIVDVDMDNNAIWVDYIGNPLKKTLLVSTVSSIISIDEIKQAMLKNSLVQLNFVNGSPVEPIISDIFVSIKDKRTTKVKNLEDKTLLIKADRLILEGTTEVIIRSGKAKTIYQANGGKLMEEAERIDSSAQVRNSIKGGSIALN